MAFGLGFNKAKTLEAAKKFVDKGKLPAAIEEYRKILAKDPKDLTILNTVGDMYVRLEKKEEAVKCFYQLADNFLEKGFALRPALFLIHLGIWVTPSFSVVSFFMMSNVISLL